MIDEAGEVATFGCVYNGIVIHTEHVAAADALILIALLSHVSNNLENGDEIVINRPHKKTAMLKVWVTLDLPVGYSVRHIR